MRSNVLFSSVKFDRYDPHVTLPAKFGRLIEKLNFQDTVNNKLTVIKMHLGREIGYSTIHPLFVKILIDKLKSYGAKVFITDQIVSGAKARGYTEEYLGVPVVQACGVTGKYYYEKYVDFDKLKNIDISGNIYDSEVMINLSHVKGHGACGYGGACKNIAMGCVTDRTRSQIHSLEGGLEWNEELCIHCEQCIINCNHHANKFNKDGKYNIFFHHCTFCQHCAKVCPTNAIKVTDDKYVNFQKGMALCTDEVLKTFEPGNVFYINFLTNITALCDCWGLTTPSLVPDIGIMASKDIVSIERASIDSIKFENINMDGVPQGLELGTSGHLFERLHGKNPFIQLDELEERGLGTQEYNLIEVN